MSGNKTIFELSNINQQDNCIKFRSYCGYQIDKSKPIYFIFATVSLTETVFFISNDASNASTKISKSLYNILKKYCTIKEVQIE